LGSTIPASVPTSIARFIDFVAGLQLPTQGTMSQVSSSILANSEGAPNANSGVQLTPAIVRDLYSLPSAGNIPQSNNVQGIAAFNNESFLPTDLAQFQKMNQLPLHPVDHSIGPATLPKGGTGEGDLDVEWIMGVAPTIPTTVWATAGQRFDPCDGKYDNEPFLKWLVNVSATPHIPNIFSISFQDFEDGLSVDFMDRVSNEFGTLAARGTTVVTGSGDWGTGCLADGLFRADFPSSSPYVVSVGATTFSDEFPTPTPGAEVGIHFSSGGFSNTFGRPSYQSQVVETFLAKHNTAPKNLFNQSGRAFPDVSAVGWNFQYVINGKVGSVGGTSASSPTFAAVLSLINSKRLAAGDKTLGWVNPLLYRSAATSSTSFHDVIVGNNGCDGCAGAVNKSVSCIGFNASIGWDPMTGLGTPNYAQLVKSL